MRNSDMRAVTLEQQLAALADGTLRGRRRKKAESSLAERPDLRASLERQREVVALMRAVTPGLPPKLWTRIEEARRRAGPFPRRRFP
jgi:anti-sigma factor RsiW